jgi:hypothetical protein
VVTIGIDPHKNSLTAVALQPSGEAVASIRLEVTSDSVARLRAWAGRWSQRRWAVEGASGLGRGVAQGLAAADELVVDVPAQLADLPVELLPYWFDRLLRDGMALTLAGDYESFPRVAAAALRTLTRGRLDDGMVRHVLAGFAELPAHRDVGPAMRLLAEHGMRMACLTNAPRRSPWTFWTAVGSPAMSSGPSASPMWAPGSRPHTSTLTASSSWAAPPASPRWSRRTRGTATAPVAPG